MQQEIEAVTHDLYQQYHKKADDLIHLVSLAESVSNENMRTADVLQYFDDFYDIKYIAFTGSLGANLHKAPVKFSRLAVVDRIFSESTDGFTEANGEGQYIVTINVDNPVPRITYTVLHEVAHIAFQLAEGDGRDVFRGHDIFAPLTPTQQAYEREAGYIAGMLILNDAKLESLIMQGLSFERLSLYSGLGYKALHNRIFGWLNYTMEYNKSLDAVMDYRHGNSQHLRWVVNAWNNYQAQAIQG